MKHFFVLGFLAFFPFFNIANAQPVSISIAAHLSLHSDEHLVSTNKIAPAFQSDFRQVSIKPLTQSKPTDPAFKATILQSPGTDGMTDMVDIYLDANGKTISASSMPMTSNPNPAAWPSTDPLSLAQLSMHYLLEDYQSTDGTKELFTNSFSQLVISQEKDSAGKLVAVITMKNSVSPKKLVLRYTPDGNFISVQTN